MYLVHFIEQLFFFSIKMENLKLRRLALFIENEEREDFVIIFAEPYIKVKLHMFQTLTI